MSRQEFIDNIHMSYYCLDRLGEFSHRYEKYLDVICDTAPDLFRDTKPVDPTGGLEPGWMQQFFTWMDALSLCAVLRVRNPETYCEVGSGNSTRFARWCIKKYGLRTQIVCVDPEPRVEVGGIADRVYRQKVEDVPRDLFLSLRENDVLFYDASHIMSIKTDMNYVCFDIFPYVNENVMLGFHDTYVPVLTQMCEDYFIAPLLLGGDRYAVDLPTYYLTCVNRATRERLLSLLDLPEAGGLPRLHDQLYANHRKMYAGDFHGCTFFWSRVGAVDVPPSE